MNQSPDRKAVLLNADLPSDYPTAVLIGRNARTLRPQDSVAVLKYDRWFKARMLFLLLVACAYLLKLIFFRDVALANFEIPNGHEQALAAYLNWRIVSALGLIGLYLFSYLKRWHFGTVSWVVAGIAVTALISDYLRVYVLTVSEPPQWMFGLLLLRFAAIACLLVNAVNARRLPPRHLHS